MRNVLIAFDGSDSSKHAVQYVIDFAQTHGATLNVHLINVEQEVALYGEYVSAEMIANIQRSMLDKAEHKLDWAHGQLNAAGIVSEKHSALGNVAERINDAVKQLKCDTVVMGTRGLGTFTGMVMGSVATRVIHEVEVPVLLVK